MIERESSDVKPILMPSDAHHFGYAVFGSDLHLREASPSFQSWVGDCQIGVPIDEILAVFAGVESTLTEIMRVELPYWYLENIAHSQAGEGYRCFLNILVLPHRQEDGLFVTIRDVTAEEAITRRAVQQRNLSWLQARDDGSDRLSDDKRSGHVEPAVGRDSAISQVLVRELCISTMAAVGQCLHLMRRASTWEEFLVTKMVLASCLRVDVAIASLLPGNPTMLGSDADGSYDLAALIQDVASDFQSWIATNELGIDFRLEQVPDVVGFGPLLREALALLLVNSIHYSAGGGRADVAVVNHLQGVLVKVSSSGSVQPPGIEYRNFQSYWQELDVSVSTRTMLAGLHLVHTIAVLHGGRFSLKQVEGGDVAFLLWFPTGENSPQTVDSEVDIAATVTSQQPDASMLLDNICSCLNLMFLLTNEELVIQFASPLLETQLDRDLVGRTLVEAIPALAGLDQELYRIIFRQEETWRIRGIQLAESGQSQYDVSLMPRSDEVGLILAARQIFMQSAVEQVLRQQRNELSLSFEKLAEQASALRTASDHLAGLDRETARIAQPDHPGYQIIGEHYRRLQ